MFANLKRRISFLVFVAVLLLSFSMECFAAEANADIYYISSENGLYLRSGPSKEFDVIAILPYGEKVEVIDKSNQYWYKITYSQQTGYVSSKYVTTQKPSGSVSSASETEASTESDHSDTGILPDNISINSFLDELKEVGYIFLIGFIAIIFLVVTITVIKKRNTKKQADIINPPSSTNEFDTPNSDENDDDEYDDDEYDLSYDSTSYDDEIDDDE